MSTVSAVSRRVYFFAMPNNMPYRARVADVTYDIYAHEDVRIPAKTAVVVKTNIAIEIDEGESGMLSLRRTYSERGLLANDGFIDCHYTEPLTSILFNTTDEDMVTRQNDRNLQLQS